MTTHEAQPAPQALTQDDLDTVVAGETRSATSPSAPPPAQTSGMAYATLTVGGASGLYR